MARLALAFLIFSPLLHFTYATPVDPVISSIATNAASTPPATTSVASSPTPAATLASSPTPATSLVSTQAPTIPAALEGPAATSANNYTTLEIQVSPGAPQATQTAGFGNVTAPPIVNKTVAYFVTEHGNAVIDGDIIFGTEAQLLGVAVNTSIHKRAFSEISSSPKKWAGGVVYYKWDAGLDTDHKNYFLDGAREWTNRLPFLSFVYDPNDTSGKARTVKASDGNRSPIGCCNGDIELCPTCNPRSARHEIGHSKFRNMHLFEAAYR